MTGSEMLDGSKTGSLEGLGRRSSGGGTAERPEARAPMDGFFDF